MIYFFFLVAGHLVSIIIGMVACLLIVAFFRLVGTRFVGNVSLPADAADQYRCVTGAAIFLATTWYGVKLGLSIPLTTGVLSAVCLAWSWRVMGKKIATPMGQGNSNPAFPDRFVSAFAAFYVLAYCLVPASMFAETLPLNLVTYNNDLFHYINVANYYLHLGPHNIDASFHTGEGYWVTPGAYHFLALFGALFGGNVVLGAMPLVYGSIALIGAAVVRLQREAFETPAWLAFAVAALLLSSVFFRIVYGSGFLAQYVASAVLLWGMVQSVRSVAEGRTSSWRGMIILLLPYAFVEFYTYPPLFVVLLAIATTIICASKVLGGAAAGFSPPRYTLSTLRVLPWWLGVVVVLVLAVSLFDPSRAWNIFFGYVPNLTTAHVGWVLDLIPVYALFGLPGPLQLTAWWYKFWIAAGALLLAVNLHAYVLRPHAFATAARKSLVVLAAVAFTAYLGYFGLVWKSYQQWKFASYLPLLSLFVLYASTWRIVATRLPPIMGTPRLLGCVGALVLAALVANLTDPRALPTDVHRATALAQLRTINGIGGIDAVYVYMNDQGQTMLAPYFIDRLPLHFLSWSYYPIEDYDPDKINPRHPLFWQDAQCDGVADAIAFPEAGCLFRHAPVLPLEFTQMLGSEYHAVPGLQLEGVSGRESSGYWTDGDRAALTVYASPADVAAQPVIWLNLRVQPIERDGWLDKIRAFLSDLDLRVPATLRIGAHVAVWPPTPQSHSWWISIPCRASDWIVAARAKLTLQVELHNPVVSAPSDPLNPYIKRVGWHISAVSLSRKPWGDAIELDLGS